jgi:hypothetical protein
MGPEYLALLYLLTTVLVFLSPAAAGSWSRVSSPKDIDHRSSANSPLSRSAGGHVRMGLKPSQAELLLDWLEANGHSHREVVMSPKGDYAVRV